MSFIEPIFRINSRLNYTEEWITELEDRVMEITDTKQKSEKNN